MLEKDKYHISHVESKIWHKWSYLQIRDETCGCQGGGVWRRGTGSLGLADAKFYM